jgi:hypothetical protein
LKKEARLLLGKGINSLILGIEHFNRPSDRGRIESVLIFLDHSFEMLLKASILHRGGKIRERRAKQTIGFDACVRKALSDSNVKFLTPEQALTLQAINSLRDAAQHHLVDLSEQHLYLHAQSGVTLFRDLQKAVFDRELTSDLPERVLPVSTKPPAYIETLFDTEVEHIKTLLRPKSRRRVEAYARLRGLAILEGSIQGERIQPGTGDLNRLARKMRGGQSWNKLFPGVASVEFTAKGYGPSLDLRISKKEGTPVHLVPEGTPGAAVVAIRRVDELGFYNLSLTQLAEHVGLSAPKATALIRHLNMQFDADCFKQIVIGQSKFNRYSQKALEKIKKELPVVDMQKVWAQYGPRKTKAK